MSIYDNTPAHATAVRAMQRRATKNPAKALYDYWLTVLEGCGQNYVRLGDQALQSSKVDDRGRPIITASHFSINAKGEFQIWGMHGAHQRNMLARHTFLQWAWHRSSYNWYVNPHFQAIGWYGANIGDWQAPVRYISEGLIQAKQWRGDKPWLKLLPDDNGGWYIWLARDEANDRYTTRITEADFEKFEALRKRRYWLMERTYRVAVGDWDMKGRRIPTEEEREEQQAEKVSLLVAHLDVSAPARTVPLRKTKKEDLWQPSGSH